MKNLYLRWCSYITILALLVCLLGCSVPPTPTLSPSGTPLFATSAPTPSLSNTPFPNTPASSPSPEMPTRTPSPTWTPSPPTSTPAPTLTTDEEQELVLGLFQDNAGCQLPCWWGFTPGETAWQTAQSFFTLLGKTPVRYNDSRVTNYSVNFNVSQHDIQISQTYDVSNSTISIIVVVARTIRNHEVVYGDAQFAKDLQPYTLPQLLATYGQPQEVLLITQPYAPEWIPFSLLLFYPQQGILTWYYGPAEKEGENIHVCPQQTEIHLRLWSPERTMTLEDIAGTAYGLPADVSDFRSLEEATGMSVEQFYQTFVQPTNQTCLETPADMWP